MQGAGNFCAEASHDCLLQQQLGQQYGQAPGRGGMPGGQLLAMNGLGGRRGSPAPSPPQGSTPQVRSRRFERMPWLSLETAFHTDTVVVDRMWLGTVKEHLNTSSCVLSAARVTRPRREARGPGWTPARQRGPRHLGRLCGQRLCRQRGGHARRARGIPGTSARRRQPARQRRPDVVAGRQRRRAHQHGRSSWRQVQPGSWASGDRLRAPALCSRCMLIDQSGRLSPDIVDLRWL